RHDAPRRDRGGELVDGDDELLIDPGSLLDPVRGPVVGGPGGGVAHLPRVRREAVPPGAQWKKCRSPVKYIVTPAASAAATTSSSRTEPPGCTIARTPPAMRISTPSAKGKNASLA